MRKEFPAWRHHGYSYCRVMGLVLVAYLWSLKCFLGVPLAWCQIANRWTSKETRWKYLPRKRRPSDRYGSWCSHCCHHEWSVERTIKLPDAIAVSGNIELAHRSSYQLALDYVAVSSPSWCDATLTKLTQSCRGQCMISSQPSQPIEVGGSGWTQCSRCGSWVPWSTSCQAKLLYCRTIPWDTTKSWGGDY